MESPPSRRVSLGRRLQRQTTKLFSGRSRSSSGLGLGARSSSSSSSDGSVGLGERLSSLSARFSRSSNRISVSPTSTSMPTGSPKARRRPSNAASASSKDASRKAARCGPAAAAVAVPAAVAPLSASDGEEDAHVDDNPEQLDGAHSPQPDDGKTDIRLLDVASLSLEGSQGHANEDRVLVTSSERFHLFAVMDGHGGSWAGDFLVERLLSALEEVYDDGFEHARVAAAMEELDRVFCALAKRQMDLSGACLLAVLLFVDPATSTPQKLVLNIGDCRAVVRETPPSQSEAGAKHKGFRPKSKKPKAQILALSSDHCATNRAEKMRALRSGAVIQHGRIAGVLEPFRSIGDIDMKTAEMKDWVIPTPELRQSELLLGQSLLVLATDGVWGVLSNQRVMAVAQREIHTRGREAAAAAEAIAREARDCGSTDDISVVLVSV